MGDGTTLLNPREMGEEDYAELYRRRALTPALLALRAHISVERRAAPVCWGRHLSSLRARSVFISTGLRTECSQADRARA